MPHEDRSNAVWRDGVHHDGDGSNLTEVHAWRKSSLSGGNGGSCVEVAIWRKSTLSGNGSNCVEVALTGEAPAEAQSDRLFLVRDSKDPDGSVLSFGRAGWNAFLTAIKSGGFDTLG
ncbi:DUF397 domain-containing protein [Streptosporangium roseum]|uniref:DUF397 domain-containing protein n=1 Tax=Streptosporangium roseum TaxID=2001 RepID=UPI00332BDA48